MGGVQLALIYWDRREHLNLPIFRLRAVLGAETR
jgi:hypothetical protein